jgi:tetratricopeptide (TPR) repeat protein
MLQRVMIVVSLACLAVAPASGQETPASAPTSQPAQEVLTGTPAEEPVSWEQMSVEELLRRAEQLLAAGQLRDVLVVLSMVRQKDPQNLEAKVVAAKLAEAQGDMNTARRLYLEVLAAESSHFGANLGMGKAWVRARHWHQARRYLERAALVAPTLELSADVQANLAMAYQGAYEREEAIKAAKKAVADDPDNLQARQVLIGLYLGREEYDQAIIHAQQMVAAATRTAQRRPSDLQALQELSGAYTVQIQVLRSYQQTLYEMAADQRYTDRLLPGQQRNAAETLRQVIELMLRQTELTRELSYHGILPLAEMRVEYAPNDIDALMQYGMLLRNTARTDQAIAVFQSVLTRDASNVEARRQLEELGVTPASRPAVEGTGGAQPAP